MGFKKYRDVLRPCHVEVIEFLASNPYSSAAWIAKNIESRRNVYVILAYLESRNLVDVSWKLTDHGIRKSYSVKVMVGKPE